MNLGGNMCEVDRGSKPLKLSRSGVIDGAELYDGTLVDKFDTGWHFHDGWQFVAVTQGERRYQFKSGTVVAKPGRLVLLPPNLVHKANGIKHEKTSFKIATFPALPLSERLTRIPIELSDLTLFDHFLATYQSLQEAKMGEGKETLLSHIQATLAVADSAKDEKQSRAPSFVTEMKAYLLQSLDRVPSLASLSARACISPYHLAHTFTKFIGLSPLAFHARARLLKSRTLISEGNSLSDVALSLGFSDQSHFGRHFRSVYAMTPSQYRRSVISPRR
ncbi:helix-turn-helix domain-containing protein [Terriglobus roseus]|uniref:Transcriptional regulator, AraC family n=1 Tax=Terriglobus roseus TaxID=392734 RepID=A0A1G7L582_9BACT|nr:AraC family transcriptional regulator [Terriglobus roseus]SDF44551.1 transcriptional regulator, AraC family [Terriglobus roseus]